MGDSRAEVAGNQAGEAQCPVDRRVDRCRSRLTGTLEGSDGNGHEHVRRIVEELDMPLVHPAHQWAPGEDGTVEFEGAGLARLDRFQGNGCRWDGWRKIVKRDGVAIEPAIEPKRFTRSASPKPSIIDAPHFADRKCLGGG